MTSDQKPRWVCEPRVGGFGGGNHPPLGPPGEHSAMLRRHNVGGVSDIPVSVSTPHSKIGNHPPRGINPPPRGSVRLVVSKTMETIWKPWKPYGLSLRTFATGRRRLTAPSGWHIAGAVWGVLQFPDDPDSIRHP